MLTHFELARSPMHSSGFVFGRPEARLPTRSTIMAAVAVLALTAGGASAAPQLPSPFFSGGAAPPIVEPCAYSGGPCVYDQNSGGTGIGIDSQNFTSGSLTSYNDAGADDFVFASAQIVHGIDVSGLYFNGSGPATSVNVTFYDNLYSGGINQPGAVIAQYLNQPYTTVNGAGNFEVVLQLCKSNSKGKQICKAKPRRFGKNTKKRPYYWVSVVANCNFGAGCGEWGWETRTPIAYNPAVWEGTHNPTSWPSGCQTWTILSDTSCLAQQQSDFMFDLF